MKLHFQSSPSPAAQQALRELSARYGQTANAENADAIVALGGDGQTLHALQAGLRLKKPVFGLNFGHVGFLQNLHREGDDLVERIANAEIIILSPLLVRAEFAGGDIRTSFAINEVHICNHNRAQGIYLRVLIDGEERVACLGADGLIISTTIGSTGYNKSARGPILPLGDDLIALTPNNAFVPSAMRSSVIRPYPIIIEVIDPQYRHADVYADTQQVGEEATRISTHLDKSSPYRLLFDQGYSLHEKIMRTQFSTPGVT
jgi:NAD+ kinase